jgi:hypothetical protein
MSFFNKERESTGALESKYAKLEKERERLQLRAEVRSREKEIKRLSHPYQEEARGVAKGTGKRIVGFAGKLIKEEAIPSFRKTSKTLKRSRGPVRQSSGRRSFVAPQGTDISLSGSIARDDWHGEGRTVMDRDFFGSSQQKDLLGLQSGKELIGGNSDKKKNQRYY